jgi:PII-like signaling protein
LQRVVKGFQNAEVLIEIMGFDSSRVVHTTKFWEITKKISLVHEIADYSEKTETFT